MTTAYPVVTELKARCFLLVTLVYNPMKARYNGADVSFLYESYSHLVIWHPQGGNLVSVYRKGSGDRWFHGRWSVRGIRDVYELKMSLLHHIATENVMGLFDELEEFANGLDT